ncbi:Oxoglutarate/iron-dependent dioxygenase [Macleaya cordata]|uniref:Oxoglutarate/iron-dependent dioxygenase n=1 Tax=Macleaya cordata TaxID=56857 RepID=A0A200QIT1_MACCD|nr:Oxoglutarate/iron-dependent dioxygenase [Macleaya cordata]
MSTAVEQSMGVERVQSLALKGISELPAHFVRSESERPENSKAVEGIKVPVISLSQPNKDVLVHEISKACSEWGFFALTDHGVSQSLFDQLRYVGEEFFKLSAEEKERHANDFSSGKVEGYGTKLVKNNDEKLEWVDYYFHLIEVTEEYTKEVLRVNYRILELLSEGLGLEEKSSLKNKLGGDEIELEMKINMYPPCPQPQLVLGVEPHTDMSALTIIVPNDVLGLQVWKDGNWIAVDYFPDALYVHVGDQIEVLSNGKYKSVLHRSLVNKERTRMSWAVFSTPPHEAVIGPLSSLVNDQTPSKYSTKTYGEYRYRKINRLPQ